MIACLSLNPCWDKTMTVPQFFLDAPNRVQTLRADVGGKGVNVARAAAALGAEGGHGPGGGGLLFAPRPGGDAGEPENSGSGSGPHPGN